MTYVKQIILRTKILNIPILNKILLISHPATHLCYIWIFPRAYLLLDMAVIRT